MSPRQQFPAPTTCHFSPTNAAMPGLSVTMMNSCLMAKLSGPIPVCLLSCKTFPWLTRENLGENGKRLGFQNIKLPLPLPPATLPANHLKKRKPTDLEEARVGPGHYSTACWPALSFQQEGTLEDQFIPCLALAQTRFTQRKKLGPAKGTALPPYLVTKISTRVYSRASKYSVSADTPTLCLQSL